VQNGHPVGAGEGVSALLDPRSLVRLLVSLLGQIGVRRYVICVKNGPDMNVVASKIDGPPPQGELLPSIARIKGPTFTKDLVVRGRSIRAPCWIR